VRAPLPPAVAALALACGVPPADDAGLPADTAADTDPGGDDTGTGPSFAMDAEGTFDGTAFHAQCDATTLDARAAEINEIAIATLECVAVAERDPYVRVTVGAQDAGPVASCGISPTGGATVNVGFADTNFDFYDCAIEDESSFEFVLDTAVHAGDGTWTLAGSFAMAGGNTGHTVDVTGTFDATVLPAAE
jgi:hypothetical protein